MELKKFRVAVRKFEPFETVLKLFWDKYKAETGCDLELESVPMDLNALYDSLISSGGLTSGEWDVAQVNTDWITEAACGGLISDIGPYIDEKPPEDYPHGWSPSMLVSQTFNHKIYGLPFHDGPECFLYRKDLFTDPVEQKEYFRIYGKPLNVPKTWDEFVQVARYFTRPDQNLYGTIFAAFPDRHNTVFDFALQLWSRGGEMVDSMNNICLNSPEALEAMTFYRSILNDAAAVHPGCREAESITSGRIFASGQIAMMVNWFGFAAMCETLEESKVKGKVGLAAIPTNEGVDPISLNVYYTWSVASGSRNKDIAYDFIRFCVSRENDRILPLKGAIGCRRSTWNDEEVNGIIPYYRQLNQLHANAREFPKLCYWHEITRIIDELVLEVINTERPIADILEEAQDKVLSIVKPKNG